MSPDLQLLFAYVGIGFSVVTLILGGLKVWTSLHPLLKARKDQRVLIDELTRGHFDEDTIRRSTRWFIRPKCSNIDPAREKEIRHALTATREDLFKKVNQFIEEDADIKHLLVLADSRTGKTTFVLNYYVHHNSHKSHKKNLRLAIVPLGVEDADSSIAKIPEPEKTVIFLDAFDEDAKAVSDHRGRILDLMRACKKYKRVIVTCRTQFFKKDEEIPRDAGVMRIGPRKAGVKGSYEFRKLYLSPFDDKDVKRFLVKRYPFWRYPSRRRALAMALKIPFLSVRPMLLVHIPDVVEAGEEISHVFQLYDIMIEAWLEREAAWVKKELLREFSERLAIDLYVKRESRGMERAPHDELPALAEKWRIPLERWKLGGRSLLNRDAEGNFKFAHRSIMEYLFVQRFLTLPMEERPVTPWTDQMKAFLIEKLKYGSSGKNLARVDLSDEDLSNLRMHEFDFSEANLEKSNLEGASLRGAIKGASFKGAIFKGAIFENSDTKIKFVFVPPGRFMMGSPEDESGRRENEIRHEVTLTKGFLMQTTAVTVGKWRMFVQDTGYKTEAETWGPVYDWIDLGIEKTGGYNWRNPGFTQLDSHPVTCVSWTDAGAFIEWMNEMEGAHRYRLPTEAEWEYACRAGTDTPFSFGPCLSTDQANYDGNNPLNDCPKGELRKMTTSAGSLASNSWGLYDMHGHVWEWCQDWYGEYPTGSITDPSGPDTGSKRVVRGGDWQSLASQCRSAVRGGSAPDARDRNLGFRLVRSI